MIEESRDGKIPLATQISRIKLTILGKEDWLERFQRREGKLKNRSSDDERQFQTAVDELRAVLATLLWVKAYREGQARTSAPQSGRIVRGFRDP